MKKIIKHSDGTIVEIEGDAKELREYERGSSDDRQDEDTKKGKRLLTDERAVRLIEEALDRHGWPDPHLTHRAMTGSGIRTSRFGGVQA